MDKKVWANIETGDKESYAEAYVFYYKKLYNYGRKITEDVAMVEDSINEVFIMIWTNRSSLKNIVSPPAYLFSSFRNTIFQKIKTAKYLQFSAEDSSGGIQFSIDSIIIERESLTEMKAKVQKALQSLTDRQREAIFLRFYEGLSYKEISEVMNVSVKATYKLMARALVEMKDLFSLSSMLVLTYLNHIFLI